MGHRQTVARLCPVHTHQLKAVDPRHARDTAHPGRVPPRMGATSLRTIRYPRLIVAKVDAQSSATAARIISIVFGDTEVMAAWGTPPGELWVSDVLMRAAATGGQKDGKSVPGHLLDPESPIGLVAMSRSRRSAGTVVGLRGADGSLVAAVAADAAAQHCWQRAILSVETGHPHPVRAVVDRLLSDGALAIAQTVAQRFPALRRADPYRSPAIAILVLDHLALRLRAIDPSLIHPDGGIAKALNRIDKTAADLRLHLPHRLEGIAGLPPDFSTDETSLRRWLSAPVGPGPFAPSRLLASVHANRVDLAESFPDLTQERWQVGLWRWAQAFGSDPDLGGGLPAWATRPPRPIPSDPLPTIVTGRAQAVRVVGYLEATLGLGEAARVAVNALELAGEVLETTAYRHVVTPSHPFRHRSRVGQQPADIELICLSGDALARWVRSEPLVTGVRPYRIGLWFWETDRLSPSMTASLHLLDEVWVTSAYTADTVHKSSSHQMPVHVVPLGASLPVAQQTNKSASRQQVALHCEPLRPHINRQWCGFSFDLSSRLTRKNPIGLIEAWSEAFPHPTSGGPLLVVKTVNGAAQPGSLTSLRGACETRADIIVVHDAWTAADHHRFITALDLYASLHRSEGYGLVLLAAMAAGVPVLATGATGNMEFMDETTALLVGADSYTMQYPDGPYPAGSAMFQPRHDDAVALLRQALSTDPIEVANRADRTRAARERVTPLVDGSAAAAWISRRLAAIRSQRG